MRKGLRKNWTGVLGFFFVFVHGQVLHMESHNKHSFSQQTFLSCIVIYLRQVIFTTIQQGSNCHPDFTDKESEPREDSVIMTWATPPALR